MKFTFTIIRNFKEILLSELHLPLRALVQKLDVSFKNGMSSITRTNLLSFALDLCQGMLISDFKKHFWSKKALEKFLANIKKSQRLRHSTGWFQNASFLFAGSFVANVSLGELNLAVFSSDGTIQGRGGSVQQLAVNDISLFPKSILQK